MKRQQFHLGLHQNMALPVLCLSVLILTSACSCMKGWCPSKQATQSGISSFIVPDSIACATLSDTVISVLTQPKKVSLYTLSPLTRPSDHDFTIGNYKVIQSEGEIPLDYYSVLMFMLADSCTYDRGDNIQAIKFMPSQAVSVVSEMDSVSLLFSYASMEIGIVHGGNVTNIFRYNNQRPFMLFFNNILHNDIYNKLLNTIQQ